ncbi:MAG: hypothetical protein WC654_07155 [Patescibacteria group bacterium]
MFFIFVLFQEREQFLHLWAVNHTAGHALIVKCFDDFVFFELCVFPTSGVLGLKAVSLFDLFRA